MNDKEDVSTNICGIKTQLLLDYHAAADLYAKAVWELAHSIGGPRVDSEKLHIAAEKARTAAHEAKNNLDAHIFEHGC
jgi:hypothetical protein